MFIYSFKFRWLRVTAWILLIVFLVTGVYFMFAPETEKIPKTEESVEAWQV